MTATPSLALAVVAEEALLLKRAEDTPNMATPTLTLQWIPTDHQLHGGKAVQKAE